MKLKDLLAGQSALGKLWVNDKLPARTAFRLGKLLRAIGLEFEEFEKQRAKLQNADDAEKQLEELLEEEVSLPEIKISLEDLNGLSPAELMSIEWMIDGGYSEA